ncbi:MAG TPA: cyclic nucleotide-binding domain-containing protein [Labilithrix sp.]|nr:cyclic nucleotide-binding domain-containing protein [Labilithrix sp.]
MAEREASSRLLREIFLAGFMSGLPAENAQWASARLARKMSDVRLAAGEVLYRRDEPTDAHYFIVSGAIRLEAEGKAPWVLAERSLVGTLDITLERPRARTAVAARDSFLLRMPASDWMDMLEDNFELTLRALHGLSEGVQRLRLDLPGFPSDADPPAARPASHARPVPTASLGLVERVFLLKDVGLFAGAEIQSLTNLAELAEEVSCAAGEVLDPERTNDALLVVVSGEVKASHPGSADTPSYGPGRLVFGPAAAGAKDLGYEAVTTEPARLLRIAREDYYDVLEEHFGLARSSLKALAAERERLVDEKERRALA